MTILEFFRKKLPASGKWVHLSEELGAHERSILRDYTKSERIEVRFFNLDEPALELETEFLSMDFLSPRKIFVVNFSTSQKKWSEPAERIWQKLLEITNPSGHWLMVSTEKDSYTGKDVQKILNGSKCSDPMLWVEYFSELSKTSLSYDKLQFLANQFTGEILELKQWVDLWNLGGDEWAKHALGWGVTEARTPSDRNLSYDWVDAALAGNKKAFYSLSEILLLKEGEDPIRLLALLGKSVKILAQLSLGDEIVGEPPFLIQKLKRIKFRPELLDWWCRCDLALKSSRADAMALMECIP